MKIKKAIDLCKKRGIICLFEAENEQWISDGLSIMYPMFNMPRFSAEELFSTYDLTGKRRDDIVFRPGLIPSNICVDDVLEGEKEAVRAPMEFRFEDTLLIPYMTTDGVRFVTAASLSPFMDETDWGLYERRTEDGQVYFAVKRGFMLLGIVLPTNHPTKDMADYLYTLAVLCRKIFDKQEETENE